MAMLEILKYPDPLLRKRSAEITTIDQRLRDLAQNMTETMYAANGIGIAAPQVGVLERLILVDLSCGEDKSAFIALINPEITASEGEITIEEGCLSVPGLNEDVTRPCKISVTGYDLAGKKIEMDCEDLLAVALQHEVDHLNGVLFTDRISKLKRSRWLAKRRKELLRERDAV